MGAVNSSVRQRHARCPVHKGRQQISDLSPALRTFVGYEFSMLWRDVKRTNAAFILHTVPPFRLVNAKTHEVLKLRRMMQEEHEEEVGV